MAPWGLRPRLYAYACIRRLRDFSCKAPLYECAAHSQRSRKNLIHLRVVSALWILFPTPDTPLNDRNSSPSRYTEIRLL